jgi:S1-C subfamily serine protease
MPSHTSVPRRRRGFAAVIAFVSAVAGIVLAIDFVVAGAPPTRASTEAVFRIEGLGCKRKPTRTVGTVVSEPSYSAGQLVLTVAHGVVGQDSVVALDGDRRIPMQVVAVDTEWDLAVLQAASPLFAQTNQPVDPVQFAEARVGNASFVVFDEADGGREIQTVRPAHVVRRLRIKTEDIYLTDLPDSNGRPGLEVRTATHVGDSGGPLFNPNGELIGVVWGTSRKTAERSWATRVQAANELIESARNSVTTNGNAHSEVSRLLACAP